MQSNTVGNRVAATVRSKRYRVTADGRRKRVKIDCPQAFAPKPAWVEVEFSNKQLEISGDTTPSRREHLSVPGERVRRPSGSATI
jgi:hypothetical protein